ncbi:hypothetical protein Rs2_50647 [Raphanus sativus]|nr:hypothetical protein Rs2_50647 [Raphanus sativus]
MGLLLNVTISIFIINIKDKKHYKYVSTHDVGYWARSFLQDLERSCGEQGLLDYDGTLMPKAVSIKDLSSKSINILNTLCQDKSNLVFIVSAESRDTLSDWFTPCEKLGIAADC